MLWHDMLATRTLGAHGARGRASAPSDWSPSAGIADGEAWSVAGATRSAGGSSFHVRCSRRTGGNGRNGGEHRGALPSPRGQPLGVFLTICAFFRGPRPKPQASPHVRNDSLTIPALVVPPLIRALRAAPYASSVPRCETNISLDKIKGTARALWPAARRAATRSRQREVRRCELPSGLG